MAAQNIPFWPVGVEKQKSTPETLECKGNLNPRNIFLTMCRRASELKYHKPKEGDRYLHPVGKIFILSSYCIQMQNAEHYYLAVPQSTLPKDFDVSKYDPNSAVSYHKEGFEPLLLKYWIWLPRIEQFQEMLQPLSTITMLHLFYGFVQQGKGHWHSFKKAPLPEPTMEELWMDFTWKQLYGKMWEGMGGWVKC